VGEIRPVILTMQAMRRRGVLSEWTAALRRIDERRPFVLDHGLTQTRTWDGVAARLAAEGRVLHRPARPRPTGAGRRLYDGAVRCRLACRRAARLHRRPGSVVAGQSWGANVVVDLAARRRESRRRARRRRLDPAVAGSRHSTHAGLHSHRHGSTDCVPTTWAVGWPVPHAWSDDGVAGTMATSRFSRRNRAALVRRGSHREIVRSLFGATQRCSRKFSCRRSPVVANDPSRRGGKQVAEAEAARGCVRRWYRCDPRPVQQPQRSLMPAGLSGAGGEAS
jgi:hypothetical protein